MAIAFVAAGTTKKVASGNMAAVGVPIGHVANHILVLFTSQQDNVVCSVDQGYVNIAAGTGNDGTNRRGELWAKRDNGAEVAPTVTHTGGGVSNAIICAISGVDTGLTVGAPGAGSIFRDVQKQTGTSATTYTAPALTGVIAGDFLLFSGLFTVNDTSGATTNNWGTVAGFTERKDDCSGLGGAAATSFGIDSVVAAGAAGSITSAVGWTGSTVSGSPQFWGWICSQLAISSDVSAVTPTTVAWYRG